MDEERRLQIALHRYAAIDRLVEADIPPGGQASVLRALAAEHGHHPDTLWRWAHCFQQGGLDGLKPPARRADAGALRGLTPEMLTLAVRLREEEPRRSTATLIALLERLHPQWRGKIARPTLDRHLRRLGKTRRHLARPTRVLRRFAMAARNDLWVADFCLPELRQPGLPLGHRMATRRWAARDGSLRALPLARDRQAALAAPHRHPERIRCRGRTTAAHPTERRYARRRSPGTGRR